jgi:hypothetical protein
MIDSSRFANPVKGNNMTILLQLTLLLIEGWMERKFAGHSRLLIRIFFLWLRFRVDVKEVEWNEVRVTRTTVPVPDLFPSESQARLVLNVKKEESAKFEL